MTIREWLNNPSDFEIGLLLYEKHGTSGNLKRLMRIGGDTPKWRKTLMYELGKLQDKGSPVKINIGSSKEPDIIYTPPAEEKSIKEEYVRSNYKAVTNALASSPDVNELDATWKDLYKRCNHIKSTLSLTMDPEERRKAVLYILDTFDHEIHPLMQKVDYYHEHGSLPPEEVIKVKSMDPLSLVSRRNYLRSYISKAKKGDKYLKADKIPEWQSEILAIESELEKLKKSV